MLMWVVWLDLVVYVAKPVEVVVCVHLDVPKSAICDEQNETPHGTSSIWRKIASARVEPTSKRDVWYIYRSMCVWWIEFYAEGTSIRHCMELCIEPAENIQCRRLPVPRSRKTVSVYRTSVCQDGWS